VHYQPGRDLGADVCSCPRLCEDLVDWTFGGLASIGSPRGGLQATQHRAASVLFAFGAP
jgi:hypothetical protein